MSAGHPSDAENHAAAYEICRGNPLAMEFCGLWYSYCHAIDDILDTMEDGRPTMAKEAILATYINAAMLYNHPFYLAHRDKLFACVLVVTNMYADSVAWERSPVRRRRLMADAMRTCGDELLFVVAMICGGWKHMRTVSPKIRERDWELQHDENDNPN